MTATDRSSIVGSTSSRRSNDSPAAWSAARSTGMHRTESSTTRCTPSPTSKVLSRSAAPQRASRIGRASCPRIDTTARGVSSIRQASRNTATARQPENSTCMHLECETVYGGNRGEAFGRVRCGAATGLLPSASKLRLRDNHSSAWFFFPFPPGRHGLRHLFQSKSGASENAVGRVGTIKPSFADRDAGQ